MTVQDEETKYESDVERVSKMFDRIVAKCRGEGIEDRAIATALILSGMDMVQEEACPGCRLMRLDAFRTLADDMAGEARADLTDTGHLH